MQKTYYARTFLDESMSSPDRKGQQHKTGRLSGMVFARKFSRLKGGKIRAERLVLSFTWDRDTQEAKADALAKVITGMDELLGLDENPPLTWIPNVVKEYFSIEAHREPENAVLHSGRR